MANVDETDMDAVSSPAQSPGAEDGTILDAAETGQAEVAVVSPPADDGLPPSVQDQRTTSIPIESPVPATEAPATWTEITTPTTAPTPPAPGISLWVWVGSAVLIVLLVFLTLLLVRARKGRSPAPQPISEPPSPIPSNGKEEVETITIQMPMPGISVGNAQHIGSRDEQQDSFGFSDIGEEEALGMLAVVADGMGGLKNGAQISSAAVKTVLQGFVKMSPDTPPPLRLVSLAYMAHKAALALNNSGSGGGSTLLLAFIQHGLLYTLSIGDSRIYLWRGGALLQLTREHIYAVDLDEEAARGDITFEEARDNTQRVALTSYLGMDELAHIDRTIRPLALQSGDKVVLMSDGVFGTLPDEELCRLLAQEPFTAALSIQNAVLNRRKPHQDNLTVVILEYH